MSVRRPDLQTAWLETTWGTLSVQAGHRGVLSCVLPEAPRKPGPFRLLRIRFPHNLFPVLKQAAAYACALLEGRKPMAGPEVDPSVGRTATAFRRAVWKAMRRIPYGKTMTYAELAALAGKPNAARAVGGACGANPVPLFIPCHRVVASGGKPGGFSCGTAWKVLLLNGEGAYP